MDAVPRVSRAQGLDVLSSMANIAGYRAVVEAAHLFGRFFAGQVTAAGKVPPAKVLVAGAGVAGLAAIGAANRLGAIVRATDPRPEVADQVESLGGTFLAVDVVEVMGADGYAKATSDDYNRRAAEIYSEQAADVDIIITTALIPGRPAPRLITAADVATMRPGSIIVDMAAGQGGNVEGSVAGEAVVTANGVTILGYTDLAGRLPTQASQLYGTNLVNLMKLLTPGKDGLLVLDWDDVVQRSITVVRDGAITWPPPPVAVSAAPAVAAPPPVPSGCRRADAVGSPAAGDRPGHSGSAVPGGGLCARPAQRQHHRLRARRGHRLLRDRPRPPRPAHAADVGDQRHLGSGRRRRGAADRPRRRDHHDAVVRRDPAGRHQHLRRLHRHPPHALDVLQGRPLMSAASAAQAAYLVAALLFILSLAGLSKHTTSRRGVASGIAGMAIALAATLGLASRTIAAGGIALIVVALAIGAAIGIPRARSVAMTGMPELIALLHSFVGGAAVLVGWDGYYARRGARQQRRPRSRPTCCASTTARSPSASSSAPSPCPARSSRSASSPAASARPRSPCRARTRINLGAVAALIALTIAFVIHPSLGLIIAVTVVALAFGWHLVASIGGGDMPVVVSMLNSYSGWAAAASGFLLDNNLLIVTGALVGSSGAYLSYIMCTAMNRSLLSVIAGGFGVVAPSSTQTDYGDHREISAHEVAELLSEARSVIITPGYGMAVAQAQFPVADLVRRLRDHGVDRAVRHPSGRGPPARPHERAARRGAGPVRHRARDGRDQRRVLRHRRGAGHRRQRHRQPRGRGRPDQPHRGHAGAAGVGGRERHRLQALDEHGLRGRAEPAVLPHQQPDALRRRQGAGRGDPRRARHVHRPARAAPRAAVRRPARHVTARP